MYFDIDKYAGKYTMLCKTEEEARNFCDYLHTHGRKWRGGYSYSSSNTQWDGYKEKTAYYFNEGCFGSLGYAQREGYEILEWSDFMAKPFTRVDPNTGDILECINGEDGVVVLKTTENLGADMPKKRRLWF